MHAPLAQSFATCFIARPAAVVSNFGTFYDGAELQFAKPPEDITLALRSQTSGTEPIHFQGLPHLIHV